MQLSDDLRELYNGLRVSIREITIFNPLEFTPSRKFPLSFKVNYKIQGYPALEKGKKGRLTTVKELTETVNISYLGLDEKDYEALSDLAYALKTLFEKRIADHEDIHSEATNDSKLLEAKVD
jgi:hypothetical protein